MGDKERNREPAPNDPERNKYLADTPRPPKERTRLVEQRATNSQTVAFVADQQATIADQAEGLAKEHPELQQFAARERANRDRLQAVVEEERRLATAIQFELADELMLAAQVREHRMELLEVAREEGRIAADLLAREAEDPTVEVMAEQAQRNQHLLLHVASTERDASRSLRKAGPAEGGEAQQAGEGGEAQEGGEAEQAGECGEAQQAGEGGEPAGEEDEWVPGTCVTGSGLASGLGIGSAMAMVEAASGAYDLAEEAEPVGAPAGAPAEETGEEEPPPHR